MSGLADNTLKIYMIWKRSTGGFADVAFFPLIGLGVLSLRQFTIFMLAGAITAGMVMYGTYLLAVPVWAGALVIIYYRTKTFGISEMARNYIAFLARTRKPVAADNSPTAERTRYLQSVEASRRKGPHSTPAKKLVAQKAPTAGR